MNKQYEYNTLVDETPDEDEGWEIVHTRTEKLKVGFFKEAIIKIYDVRRDITPIKISFNLKTTIPAWKKNIDAWEFHSQLESELKKLKLMKED